MNNICLSTLELLSVGTDAHTVEDKELGGWQFHRSRLVLRPPSMARSDSGCHRLL